MRMMVRAALGAALGVVACAQAHATSVSPVNVEMTTTGPHARAQIVMTNTAETALAVEPGIETTSIDEHGRVTHGVAGDDFLILPSQALIAPGASQVFRVQWVGEPDLAESKSYLITMNELPVRGLASRTALGVTVSFGVAVNVAAAGVMPALNVVLSGVKKDRDGHMRPFVVVENPTGAHALLKDAAITLVASDWSTRIAPGSFEQALGTGLVQPHHRREFVLPVNVPSASKALTATIDYRP